MSKTQSTLTYASVKAFNYDVPQHHEMPTNELHIAAMQLHGVHPDAILPTTEILTLLHSIRTKAVILAERQHHWSTGQ